jgi:APA family basic amino acid/polyamine antiporter
VPFYPFIPAAGILSCLWLIFQSPRNVQMFFLVFLVAAVLLYFAYAYWASPLGKAQARSEGSS